MTQRTVRTYVRTCVRDITSERKMVFAVDYCAYRRTIYVLSCDETKGERREREKEAVFRVESKFKSTIQTLGKLYFDHNLQYDLLRF